MKFCSYSALWEENIVQMQDSEIINHRIIIQLDNQGCAYGWDVAPLGSF